MVIGFPILAHRHFALINRHHTSSNDSAWISNQNQIQNELVVTEGAAYYRVELLFYPSSVL